MHRNSIGVLLASFCLSACPADVDGPSINSDGRAPDALRVDAALVGSLDADTTPKDGIEIDGDSLAANDSEPLVKDLSNGDLSGVVVKSVSDRYGEMLRESIDFWNRVDFAGYSTGHICQPTSVSGTGSSMVGQPYVTAKIHRLAKLMVSLSRVYENVSSDYQTKILAISARIYFWLYGRIDWTQELVEDDYGACYYDKLGSYSHLTTSKVVQGFRAFRKILDPSDANYKKLSGIIETLAVSQLNAVDSWMTPIGEAPKQYSTNFMALNLSVAAVLSGVAPSNPYLVNLDHRLRSDYAWIRKSWVNYSTEQSCGAPLLYGGWSHASPEHAAASNGVSFDCKYFDQLNVTAVYKSIRSYYLQKVSYHVITTEGIMNILEALESIKGCALVNYGSHGTCNEMRMIVGGAAVWMHTMIDSVGRIPAAYGSFPIDEFGYFSGDAGTIVGVRNLVQSLDVISYQGSKLISVRDSFHDGGGIGLDLQAFKVKALRSLRYVLARYTRADKSVDPWVIHLEDAPFLADRLFQ